ncbi:DUF317 domain-containing protein [Streptomyces sp. B6B3]|uniref:DUF317 domain-containing protein n=1 Tax=Streptomyces sp. B6B3 TaxID=3153570 RepID=UPI00325D055C
MPHHSDDNEAMRAYRVTPRYLAGPTFDGDVPFQPFLDLDWRPTHDEAGNLSIASPDQTIRLRYLPEGEDSPLWKITAHSGSSAPPRWLVTFDNRVPAEIVRDFATSLATASVEGHHSYLSCHDSTRARLEAGVPLTAAGWSQHHSQSEVTFRSPEALAEVRLRRLHLDHHDELQHVRERWLMTAGAIGTQWCATASSLTPEHLVAAMNAAITNPEPVIRHGSDLHRLPPQATVTPAKPDASPSLNAQRTQAARARLTTTPSHSPQGPVIPAQRSSPPPEIPGPRRGR